MSGKDFNNESIRLIIILPRNNAVNKTTTARQFEMNAIIFYDGRGWGGRKRRIVKPRHAGELSLPSAAEQDRSYDGNQNRRRRREWKEEEQEATGS